MHQKYSLVFERLSCSVMNFYFCSTTTTLLSLAIVNFFEPAEAQVVDIFHVKLNIDAYKIEAAQKDPGHLAQHPIENDRCLLGESDYEPSLSGVYKAAICQRFHPEAMHIELITDSNHGLIDSDLNMTHHAKWV